MEKLKFDSKPEYLDYLEGLVGRDISEIAKLAGHNYNFKIESTWYNLTSAMIVGTTFSEGECLILKSGNDTNVLETLYVKQFRDEKRVSRIFSKLEEAYIKHLSVSNEKTKELVKNLVEFLDKCDYIEKFGSNIYMITKQKTKYCFIRNENFSKGLFISQINIKKIVGDEEKIVDTIKEDYNIIAIFSFLEFAYYSSRLDNITRIKNLIDKHLI